MTGSEGVTESSVKVFTLLCSSILTNLDLPSKIVAPPPGMPGVPHTGVPPREEGEWDMEWRDSGRCVSASLRHTQLSSHH